MSQYTCKLDGMQVIELAALIPDEYARSIANQYLDLSDEELNRSIVSHDVQEAPHCTVYRALIDWLWNGRRDPSVEDLENLMNIADQPELFSSHIWKGIRSMEIKYSKPLVKLLLCRVALVHSDAEEAEQFTSMYLNRPESAEPREDLQIKQERLSERMLSLWVEKMGEEGNMLNLKRSLKHAEKREGHVLRGSVTAALENALSLKAVEQAYLQTGDAIQAGRDAVARTLAWHYQMWYKHLDTPCSVPGHHNRKLLMDDYTVRLRLLKYDRPNGQYNHTQTGKSTSMALSDFFNTCATESADKPLIFLEGNSGCGKSTLCYKLAWDWTHRLDNIHALSDFDHVFYVNAFELQKNESLDSYIRRVYFQHNPFIDTQDIIKVLKPSKNTLIILDNFDQISNSTQFVKNNLENGCAFVVTCNPGAMICTRKGNAKTIMIEKLEAAQIQNYLQTNCEQPTIALHTESKPGVYEHLANRFVLSLYKHTSLYGSSAIPINCKLTTLLESLHSRITQSVQHHLKYTQDECMASIIKMGKLAYELLVRNNMIFKNNISQIDQILGFVKLSYTQEIAAESSTYIFKHRLVQEFLAARYITHVHCTTECSDVCAKKTDVAEMVKLTKQISGINTTKPGQGSMVAVFVAGLLSSCEEDAAAFITDLFADWDGDRTPDCSLDYVGHSMHIILQCLSQCSSISLTHGFLQKIFKDDANLWLDHAFCDSNCLRGIVTLLENAVDSDVEINVMHYFHKEHIDDLPLLRKIAAISSGSSLSVQPGCNYDLLLGKTGVYSKAIATLQICSLTDARFLHQESYSPLTVQKLHLKDMDASTALDLCSLYGNEACLMGFHMIYDNGGKAKDISEIVQQRHCKQLTPTELFFNGCPAWVVCGITDNYYAKLRKLLLKNMTFQPDELKRLITMLTSHLQVLEELWVIDIKCMEATDQYIIMEYNRVSDTRNLKLTDLRLNNCDVCTMITLGDLCLVNSYFDLYDCSYTSKTAERMIRWLHSTKPIPLIEIYEVSFLSRPEDLSLKVKTNKLRIRNCFSADALWLLKHFVASTIRLSGIAFLDTDLCEVMTQLSSRKELEKLRLSRISLTGVVARTPVTKVDCQLLDLEIRDSTGEVTHWVLQHLKSAKSMDLLRIDITSPKELSAIMKCCRDMGPFEYLYFTELDVAQEK